MNLKELAAEYDQQVDKLEAWAHRLRQMIPKAHGEDRYKLRRELKIVESMSFDCHCMAKRMRNYYEGVDLDENGLHRQGLMGVYHAMPYTLKCFSLRGSTANGVED